MPYRKHCFVATLGGLPRLTRPCSGLKSCSDGPQDLPRSSEEQRHHKKGVINMARPNPTSLLTPYATSGKLLNLPVFQPPHLQSEV